MEGTVEFKISLGFYSERKEDPSTVSRQLKNGIAGCSERVCVLLQTYAPNAQAGKKRASPRFSTLNELRTDFSKAAARHSLFWTTPMGLAHSVQS